MLVDKSHQSQEFEKWALDKGYDTLRSAARPAEYFSIVTQAAWLAWSQVAEACYNLKQVVTVRGEAVGYPQDQRAEVLELPDDEHVIINLIGNGKVVTIHWLDITGFEMVVNGSRMKMTFAHQGARRGKRQARTTDKVD